jgi:hypothetical protein
VQVCVCVCVCVCALVCVCVCVCVLVVVVVVVVINVAVVVVVLELSASSRGCCSGGCVDEWCGGGGGYLVVSGVDEEDVRSVVVGSRLVEVRLDGLGVLDRGVAPGV